MPVLAAVHLSNKKAFLKIIFWNHKTVFNNPLLHELFQLLGYLIFVVLDREHRAVEG